MPAIYQQLRTPLDIFSGNMELAAPECFGLRPSWHDKFYSMVGTWLGFGVTLLLGVRVAMCFRAKKVVIGLKRLLLLTFTVSFTTLCVLCIKTFQYTTSGPDKRLFVYDSTVDMFSIAHVSVQITAAVIGLVVLVGLPCAGAAFARVMFKKNRLHEPATREAWGSPSRFCRTLFQIKRTALHSYGPDPHSC